MSFNDPPLNRTTTGSGTVNRPSLGNMPGPSGRSSFGQPGNTSQNDDIVCSCGEQAKKLTVKKDGPNKGRQFYACARSSCQFFLWDPDDPDTTNHNNSDRNQPGRVNNEVKCQCNQIAALRTVNKDGPNKGRQFYCCPNMNGCKFFQWADETRDGNGNDGGDDNDFGGGGGGGDNLNWSFKARPSRGRGRGRPAPYNKPKRGGGTGTRGKRKCGRCAQEGHTKNNCPN